jgi:hypothetical protein
MATATKSAAAKNATKSANAGKPTQTVSEATMAEFKKAGTFTLLRQAFKKGDSVTYEPLGTADSVSAVTKALKGGAKQATHVMAMPAGPTIPASALVARTYTLKGQVANLQLRVAKSNSQPFASFGFKRDGKDTLSCIAFGQKVAELVTVANKANGQPIKLFGYFQDRPNSDKQQFVVMKAIEVGK